MNHSQILSRLFVGSCPATTEDINHLKADLGITAILNLQTDQDLDYWDLDWPRLESHCRESGIVVRRVPIRDFDAEDLRRNLPGCVEILDGLLQAGHTVYIHCNIGSGRSPSVAIAYLFLKQHRSLDESMEQVTKWRSCSPNIEMIITSGDTVAGVYEDY
jgi:protein-tyrosine phosphatase